MTTKLTSVANAITSTFVTHYSRSTSKSRESLVAGVTKATVPDGTGGAGEESTRQ